MIKKFIFIIIALGYFIFIVAFGKEFLLRELVFLPNWLAYIINYFFGFVVTIALTFYAIWPFLFKQRNDQRVMPRMDQEVISQENQDSNDYWAIQLWRGNYSLPLALFVCNISGAFIVILCWQFVHSRWLLAPTVRNLILVLVIFAIGLGYQFISSVGTLRSAKHLDSSSLWRRVTNLSVIVTSVLILMFLILTPFGVNFFVNIKA